MKSQIAILAAQLNSVAADMEAYYKWYELEIMDADELPDATEDDIQALRLASAKCATLAIGVIPHAMGIAYCQDLTKMLLQRMRDGNE